MEVGEEEKWVGMPMAGHWGLQLLARTEGQQQGAGQERLVCSRCCLCPARLHSVCLSVCLPESLFLSFSLSLGLGVSLSAPPTRPDCASVLGTPWLRCCPCLSPARLAHCHHLFTEAGKIHSPAGGPSAPREGRRQTQEWASRERGSPGEQALGAGKGGQGV